MNYYNKYVKYKNKYLNNNLLYGGGNSINVDDTYSINILTISGNNIFSKSFPIKHDITIRELIEYIRDSKLLYNSLQFMNGSSLLNNDSKITSEMIEDNNEINLTIIVKPTNTLYDILYNKGVNRDKDYENLMRIYYVVQREPRNLTMFNTNVKINMMNGKYFILYNCTVYIEFNTYGALTVTFVFNYDENKTKNYININFYDINKDISYY